MKNQKLKIMLTPSINPPSPWLYIKVWIAERLRSFSSLFNTNLTIFSDRLIKANDVMIESLNIRREKARLLTPDLAKNKLKKLKNQIKTYENIEQYISSSSNIPLKNSFRLLIKACYRYEARLHTVAYSETPVIETPNYIKRGLSELGKKSLNNLQSTNALL